VEPFGPIQAYADMMRGYAGPWYVAGGWAIDLFLGRVTREHADLEVAVLRRDQEVLRAHMAGWRLHKAVQQDGAGAWVPWVADERLELPIHQVMAQRDDGEPREVEFFLVEAADGQWRFRRNQAIRRPEAEMGAMSSRGIPIVAPEIMLAYKAKATRPKDEHDFTLAHELLSADQRAWLKATLSVCHPDHPWIARL
jgi:Aminoglycoside-2''-adenylyltransferase